MAKDAKGPYTTETRPSSFLSLMTGWVQQGVESFLSTQKILIEMAMRKNASAMNSLRDSISDPEHSPMAILTEVAVEGTANFIEAQRILLNLVQEENNILMNGVKARVDDYPRAMAMTDALRRTIDTVVEMQQEYLTIVSKQTQSWVEPMKAGSYDPGKLADFARDAMENFVQAQKKFLDVIAEETDRMATGKPAKKMPKLELSKLAHDAANALVDSQKKLLDLAGHQMDANREVISRTKDLLMPFQILPMSNLANKGMRTVVDAEEALIDSIKDVRKPKVTPAPRATRTRATKKARTRKAAAKAATA